MGYIKYVFKRILLTFFFINIGFVYGQVTVYFEDFDAGDKAGWEFTETGSGQGTWINGFDANLEVGALGEYIYSKQYGGEYKKNTTIIATSPTINTTSYTDLFFQIDVWYKTEADRDGMKVEYSLDNGASWGNLGSVSNVNWYSDSNVYALGNDDGWSGNSGGWVTHRISLSDENSGFDDNSQVKFRVVFASDNNNNTDIGVAFDNVLIESDTYCIPQKIETYNTYFISDVSLGTINNTTSGTTGGYTDFSKVFTPTNAVVGGSLHGTITVDIDGWNTITNYLNIWIDFNQDFVFDEINEKIIYPIIDPVYSPDIKSFTVEVNIPIPEDAVLGNTRMRIGFIDSNHPDYTACDFVYNAGEVEDYTINIINGCSTNSWTGAVSSDWNNAANWDCGEVPTIISNVLIPTSVTNYPEIAAAADGGLANDIEIESGATLTVFDNSLEIDGTLLLNGTIYLEDEGQLLQTEGSILDVLSSGTLERDQQGVANTYAYNYWGSPVGTNLISGRNSYSYKLEDILYDGHDPVKFVSGYDGSVGSPISLSNYWMYKYTNNNGSYSEWQYVGSTGVIKAGEGFSMKGPDAAADIRGIQNYTFKGLPNNGVISLGVDADNEYLVANPYPSTIDSWQFIRDNAGTAITGTIYLWEQFAGTNHNLTNYQGGYATLNLSDAVPAAAYPGLGGGTANKTPTRFIPVAQGFFVQGLTDGQFIEFNNNQRVFETESSGGSIFMKLSNSKSKTASTGEEYQDLRPKFRLGFKAPQIDHRQLLLTIDENTTEGIDWGYDAEMNGIVADDMFWVLNDKKYVIQALPDAHIDREIPLGIIMGESGLATIQIDALENVDSNVELYIKDGLTGETHKINSSSFEIELEAGEYVDRFSLVFKPDKTLDLEDEILKNGLIIYVNNAAQELRIQNKTNSELQSVKLYSSLGQELRFWTKNLEDTSITLPVDNMMTGMYVVQVKTTIGVLSKKVIIK